MKNKTVYFGEFNENDLSEVVDVYIKVFSAEPWNDKLTYDQITSYVNQMTDLNTFKGYIVFCKTFLHNIAKKKYTPVRLKFFSDYCGFDRAFLSR